MAIPNHKSIVEQCKNENPTAWKNMHTGNPHTEDFVRKLVPMLMAVDENYGLNGKRGNPNDISDDAVNYLCDEEDSEGRTPGGDPCVVIDFGVSAGAPNASIGWTVFNTKIEGSGANVDPSGQQPPANGGGLLPYEALGGDPTGQAISRAMAFDYERSVEGKLNKGCGAWMFRSCWVLMSRQEGIDTADKVIAKYRPEWCRILGVPMIPIPANY